MYSSNSRTYFSCAQRNLPPPQVRTMPIKMPTETRTCIWRAHGKRCVYCGEPVSFLQLEIDHIIPERLASEPHELAKVLNELGLPSNFGTNSLLNLVPAHASCNREKSSRVFMTGNVRFFLERAAAREDTVLACIEKMKLQAQKENLLANLASGLQAGNVQMTDVMGMLRDSASFPLTSSIKFADESEISEIAQRDIEELLDKPILIGGQTEFAAEFANSSGNKMTVRTCREYRAARAAKYYADTTYDRKSEAFLKAADAVLAAVARAQPATVSYVSSPYCGVADLDLLPKELLPALSTDDAAAISAMTESSLAELAVKKQIEIISVSSRHLSFTWKGVGVMLMELLRADIDGDGIEELLVQYYKYALGGTFGYGEIGVLSRTGPDQRFVLRPW